MYCNIFSSKWLFYINLFIFVSLLLVISTSFSEVVRIDLPDISSGS